MNITGIIYAHRNKANNKYYIGQTIKSNPNARWENGNGYIRQEKFWCAIQKYGWDGFEHIILEQDISIDILSDRENYYIELYDSINNGYNVKSADPFTPMPEVVKQKIRDSWTLERREQQRERAKQQWEDPTYREIMRKAAKHSNRRDMSGSNNPMYGTHRTGKKAARKRSVECIETGDRFDTVKQAAEWLGSVGQKSHISEVCKGKRNYCGKHPITKEPLHWRYVE